MEIRTKNIRIVPLQTKQLNLFCEAPDQFETELDLASNQAGQDEALKKICMDCYTHCQTHEKEYLLYTVWLIILRNENKIIGNLRLHGPANEKHEVQLSFTMDVSYQDSVYDTEALKKFCEWAFSQNAYYIQVHVDSQDELSKAVLTKNGFILTGDDSNPVIYELEKPKSFWMSIYMCMGISLGLCFGTSFDNIAIGMSIGLSIGLAVGASLDASDKKNRLRDKPQNENKK